MLNTQRLERHSWRARNLTMTRKISEDHTPRKRNRHLQKKKPQKKPQKFVAAWGRQGKFKSFPSVQYAKIRPGSPYHGQQFSSHKLRKSCHIKISRQGEPACVAVSHSKLICAYGSVIVSKRQHNSEIRVTTIAKMGHMTADFDIG